MFVSEVDNKKLMDYGIHSKMPPSQPQGIEPQTHRADTKPKHRTLPLGFSARGEYAELTDPRARRSSPEKDSRRMRESRASKELVDAWAAGPRQGSLRNPRYY